MPKSKTSHLGYILEKSDGKFTIKDLSEENLKETIKDTVISIIDDTYSPVSPVETTTNSVAIVEDYQKTGKTQRQIAKKIKSIYPGVEIGGFYQTARATSDEEEKIQYNLTKNIK